MADVNDIIISIIGFFFALYGGLTNDLLTIICIVNSSVPRKEEKEEIIILLPETS